jgi:hypothetical protein
MAFDLDKLTEQWVNVYVIHWIDDFIARKAGTSSHEDRSHRLNRVVERVIAR